MSHCGVSLCLYVIRTERIFTTVDILLLNVLRKISNFDTLEQFIYLTRCAISTNF